MTPTARYERLTKLRADRSFDVAASDAAIAVRFKRQPIVKIITEKDAPFFVRRDVAEDNPALKLYRVYLDESSAANAAEAVGRCQLRGPVDGIVTIVGAEVKEEFQKKGIATAVYDCIASDMVSAGALLWPNSPAKMTDAEFKVWWRRSPALVFYYPHCERLGFEPRREFEALLSEVPQSRGSGAIWSKFALTTRRWLRSRGFGDSN
jgi:hypothetical protein